ncbi:MAG: MFS transporter, partial [Chloroflexi bacterium]|nr:MFS transporter [Chloroflexota bacterium]
TILATNTPAMWFRQKLGKVSALMGVGIAGASAALPPFVLWMIQQTDWRTAYATLGVSVWVIMLPLLFTLFRNKPEDVGQFVDGVQPIDNGQLATSAKPTVASTRSFALKEAMKTRAYWLYLIAFASWGMIFTAVTFNLLPLFVNAGLSETTATSTFSTLASTLIVSQLIGGALADRVQLNRLASVGILFMALAIGLLINLQSMWIGHAYALFAGLGQGLLGAVNNTIWVRYYGRQNLGKIRGSVWTATVAGSSLGPFLMGFNFDQIGSYAISLWGFLTIYAILIFAVLFATPPHTHSRLGTDKPPPSMIQ